MYGFRFGTDPYYFLLLFSRFGEVQPSRTFWLSIATKVLGPFLKMSNTPFCFLETSWFPGWSSSISRTFLFLYLSTSIQSGLIYVDCVTAEGVMLGLSVDSFARDLLYKIMRVLIICLLVWCTLPLSLTDFGRSTIIIPSNSSKCDF